MVSLYVSIQEHQQQGFWPVVFSSRELGLIDDGDGFVLADAGEGRYLIARVDLV